MLKSAHSLNTKKRRASPFAYLLMILLSFIMIYPFICVVLISLKTMNEFRDNPIGFPLALTFTNYIEVYIKGDILTAFFNSTFLTGLSVAGIIIFGSLTAYALTKMRFKKAAFFSNVFLAPMIFPIQTIIIPLYFLFRSMHLVNNMWGLITIFIAGNLPMSIFILTGFMKTIPYALSEAAFVEGANHFRVYFRIILPLIKPAIATAGIIIGIFIWNDFYLPLIMMNDRKLSPLPLKIFMFSGQYEQFWTMICTCVVFLTLPVVIVYLLLQKQIISGVVAGSVKG